MATLDVCLCCAACDHANVTVPEVDDRGMETGQTARTMSSQFLPCSGCGATVTSSRREVSEKIIARYPTVEKREAVRNCRHVDVDLDGRCDVCGAQAVLA